MFLITHLLRFSVRHPRVVITLVAAITVFALINIPRIRLRLDGRSLIPSNLPEFAEGDQAATRFALRDLVLIGVGNEESGIYTPETLRRIARLSDGLSRVEGVVDGSVISIATVPRVALVDGEVDTGPLFRPEDSLSPEQIQNLRRDAGMHGYHANVLVSSDGKGAAIIAKVEPGADRYRLLEATRATNSAESSMAFETEEAMPVDSEVEATAIALTSDYGGTFNLTWSAALKGFRLNATEAQAIAMSQDSRVAFIVEDGAIAVGTPDTDPIVMTPDPNVDLIPQPNASWGLDRVDQRLLPLNQFYAYHNNGDGVNAYVIDTGILPTHYEFRGRASAIYDAVNREGNGVDCDGHGSHVAGIIGGRTFGVAKKVRLLGVRVLNCQGSGTWSDVIDGVNFVTWHRGQPEQQGIPAVANMSLGGETNRAADAAVRNSIRAGVTYVVAAGNGNADASTYSPAGLVEAITVGATNQYDARAAFSNYGSTLDLFAPGVGIPSAWIGDDLMIATASGTSMAAPHVTGVVALYLQTRRTASPATVRSALVGTSTSGVVINPGQETPNRLLFTNY